MNGYLRLNITTEGPSEHRFVKDVLYNHLQPFGIICQVRSVLTSKEFRKRGGLSKYHKVKNDITQWLRSEDSAECRFTTMFDYYALPKDFPGYAEASKLIDPYDKVRIIESAFSEDLGDSRFVPYIQLHEFESLLFANLDMLLLEYEGREGQVEELKRQLASKLFQNNPELINDKKETSPSHRILQLIPEYNKSQAGSMLIDLISLEQVQLKCRHFNDWIGKLEALSQ